MQLSQESSVFYSPWNVIVLLSFKVFMSNWFENVFAPVQTQFLVLFCLYRTEYALLGHYRLSQEMDNQANIFAVVSKKKDELVQYSL